MRDDDALEPMRCRRCRRIVKSVDSEVGQCERCNARDMHIAALETFIASCDPHQVERYERQLEAYLKQ